MFSKLNNKKIALWLMVISLSCFAIGAVLLFQIDVKGMNKSADTQEYNVNEEKSFNEADVKNIVLDTFSSDINIMSTDDNTIKVHVYGKVLVNDEKDKPQPEIKLEGNTVFATDNKNTSQHNKVQLFSFEFNGLQSEIKMDVYIPASYTKELHISTSSGNISSDDLELSDLSINTFSGDVEAGILKSLKAVFESSSGRMTINKVIADSVKVKSFSGDFKFSSIEALTANFDTSSGKGTLGDISSKTFKYASFSGDVNIEVLKSEDSDISSSSGKIQIKSGNIEKIRYKTFSGDITGENTGAKDTFIDTSSGRVLVSGLAGKLKTETFSGDMEAVFVSNPLEVMVKTSSGKVKVELPSDASFKLNAHSSSGNPTCDFPVQITGSSDENEIIGTVGSGEGKITIDTFSGDIVLTK